MDTYQIFLTQFLMSVFVVSFLVRWYVAPALNRLPMNRALGLLMIPHTFRFVGLAFVVPQLVGPSLRTEFAGAAGYGDFITSLLAILALFLLRQERQIAFGLVWIVNIVGTLDLVNALRQVDVVPQLGVVWFIPTFIVPILLVSHFMMLARLISHVSENSNIHESKMDVADRVIS